MNQETMPAANETLRSITHWGRWTRSSTNSAPAKYLLMQKPLVLSKFEQNLMFQVLRRQAKASPTTLDWPLTTSPDISVTVPCQRIRLQKCCGIFFSAWCLTWKHKCNTLKGKMIMLQAVAANIWCFTAKFLRQQSCSTFRSTPPTSQIHLENRTFNTVNRHYPNEPPNLNLNIILTSICSK